MYVWLDALTNYITAAGYPDTQSPFYKTFWPADLHMVGKDIVRFHAVYWPAFLMSAGVAPPKRVFAHGWWTNEGQKISKSLGNVIDPFQLVETYGLDQVRYFLLREVPFGNDGDFSHAAMVRRMNAELANDYGNLVQRVLAMINRNCAGSVPSPGELTPGDDRLIKLADVLLEAMREPMHRQQFHVALDRHAEVVSAANRYVDEQAPWALKKTDPARMATVLYVLAETIRRLAVLSQPFMPGSSARILDQLAIEQDRRDFADAFSPEAALAPGAALPTPSPVFPRFVEAAA
jgi:methionyl-tRNA synthetase